MTAKPIILIIVGIIALAALGGFVLVVSVLLVAADNVETEKAGKVVIAVRHKMLYEKLDALSKTQCVEPQIGICETPPTLNGDNRRVDASQCRVKADAPQPFFREPAISDFSDYEFESEADKKYYWYVYLDNYEKCAWLPDEYAGFQTGEIKSANGETRRIEVDFTKKAEGKKDDKQAN